VRSNRKGVSPPRRRVLGLGNSFFGQGRLRFRLRVEFSDLGVVVFNLIRAADGFNRGTL
jgi:hypothetical protein